MLDAKEFSKAKSFVLVKKDKPKTLKELSLFVNNLEIVAANETSAELAEIINQTIRETEERNLLFRLYLMYFHQTYYYIQKLETTEKTLKNMSRISEEEDNAEFKAYVCVSQALIAQLKGDIDEALELSKKAYEMLLPIKDGYLDAYYRILYTYSIFNWMRDKGTHQKTIENIESCVYYWYKSNRTLSMLTAIFQLLKLYIFNSYDSKFDEMIKWIFNTKKIQNRLIDSHYTLLYTFVGTVFTIRLKIKEAKEFLVQAHERMKISNLKFERMFEYIELLKLLSRCYAYTGNFQLSYEIIIELIEYIETDFVKKNYYGWGMKRVYFAIYYTFFFIFAQLDMQIQDIEDEKLKQVYGYIKSLLEKTRFSENLLLDTSFSEKEINKITEEGDVRTDEFYLAIHQQLISLEAHKVSEETVSKIEMIRDYVHSPLYADILIGKIQLSMGNFDEFTKIVTKIMKNRDKADTPILFSWIRLFELLNKYLLEQDIRNVVGELVSLENQCRENNFHKMADEVILYQKLITSTRTLENFRERFNQTAFIDIYNNQSKEMVMEYLETSSVE